jgi:signal transduction histidine kinase
MGTPHRHPPRPTPARLRPASASASQVEVRVDDGVLRLAVTDDGVGGADPARGSGLLGLRDRVEAVAGKMSVRSPPGEGTVVLV